MLLQSAAALIAKKWVQLVDQKIREQGLDAEIITFCHDEIQIKVKGDAEYVGDNIALRSSKEAGEHFEIKIPIEAGIQSVRTGGIPTDPDEKALMAVFLTVEKARAMPFTTKSEFSLEIRSQRNCTGSIRRTDKHTLR